MMSKQFFNKMVEFFPDSEMDYNNIIEDIRTTLGIDKLSFEIDVNVISNNLFKGFLSYGK